MPDGPKRSTPGVEVATTVAVLAICSPILGALLGWAWRAFRMTAGW